MSTATPPPSQASGLCDAWCTPDQVLARPGCSGLPPATVAACVQPASEILFALSGRQYPGAACPATVRPAAKPPGLSAIEWAAFTGFGFWPTWGICSGEYPSYGVPWLFRHGDCQRPPQVELGAYPVRAVVTVKIDGVVIPDDEYRLDNNRVLVRTLPTADTVPTERYGWPTCQDLALPDTEPGTFSVAFLHGFDPPAGGVLAAQVLAAELAKAATPGMTSRLPSRVTSIAREGITTNMLDAMALIPKGWTGLPDVDLWIRSVNPSQLARRARVWSPDMPSARRIAT